MVGRYYDALGAPTPALDEVQAQLREARRLEAQQQELDQQFPSCNSRWAQGEGGKVWCGRKSGGVARDWVGVPHLMRRDFSGNMACVCVRDGDLDDPRLRTYEGCSPTAAECRLPDPA